MTFLSFRCFNGYREARLNCEFIITHFKAVFLNISFTAIILYICQLLTQNFPEFVLVTCANHIHSFSHRIYDCSYSLSPIKVRIFGVYVKLVTVIETNLNITFEVILTVHRPHHTDNLKTKAPNTTGSDHLYNTLELVMMGIVLPETCWACNKICNKYHLLNLVGNLFPHNNDDARSKSLQKKDLIKMVTGQVKKLENIVETSWIPNISGNVLCPIKWSCYYVSKPRNYFCPSQEVGPGVA